MKTKLKSAKSLVRPRRLMSVVIAFAATLLALPIRAVTIPDVPLQSGSAYPPANIMFILDNSGSMEWDFMPGAFGADEVPATTGMNIALRTSSRNTIYYDPSIDYKAWIKSDGTTRYTGGTSFDSAYSHNSLLRDEVDLDNYNETFYVLNAGGDASKASDYKRYRFLATGSVQRSEYKASSGSTTNQVTKTGQAKTQGNWLTYSFTVPSGTEQLVVTTSGGNGGDADLYVVKGADVNTGTTVCTSASASASETCTLLDPVPDTYWVAVYAYSSFSGLSLSADTAAGYWTRNTTLATPTGRSDANERANFATWYSYHRTRIKVAKAGASEAFSQVTTNLRVGFDTIGNATDAPRFRIPVGTNDGVFSGTNRDTWYTQLVGSTPDGATPLKRALQRAGEYFSDPSATGPWGPSTGDDQLSCRQNFAILTTDGYWNDDSGYTPIGDADNTGGPTNTSTTGETYTFSAVKPYIDNFTTTPATRANTLADVAMHYWKRDLVTGLDNNVPTSTADPAFWQHMVTFGISIGLQGRLNPASDLQSITNGSKHWGDPTDREDADRIDDLWHASVNGHGTFVSATSPIKFAQGLVDALSTVASRLGSASNVTANSTSFTSDTRVYQASYVSGKWTGELTAYDATSAGVSTTPAWIASAHIPASRTILTWGTTGGTTFPTSTQTTALTRTTGTAPVTGADNANYIKGTTTLERRNGGTLRNRDVLLGDIAYSSPIYVKDSDTIFVGANDGMLHAFNASTGTENFAYVPAGISLSSLATLSDPAYVHRYFVDGPVVVSTKKQTANKNYLVGALGRGGKGVFGLDVTTPTNFRTNSVLWESSKKLTAAQASDMGQVLGEPLVVKLNDGTDGVLVSNGINSTSGTAALFVLNIATGAVLKEINTGVGGDNGLSAPRGWDIDGNGTVDEVYAGDLKGNVWKFDLRGTTSGSWALALSGSPLFTAPSGQAITAGLALAQDPNTGKRWVFVGTGRFLTSGDVDDNTVQSMYGLIDDGASVAKSDLEDRDILVTTTMDGRAVRGFEPHSTLDTGKKGWFIDLDVPTAGERIVSNPRVRGTSLITASIIPPTSNTCDAGGTGYINAVDAFTGTSLTEPFFDANGDGKVDSEDKVTGGGDTVPVGSIDLGVGMPTLPTVIDKLLVVGGSNGSLGSVLVNPQGGTNQRVSWHEILRD